MVNHPEYSFYSEDLLPGHFTDTTNACIYTALTGLAKKGITTIDPYNIIEFLNSSDGTRKLADEITIDRLNELMEMSDVIARGSPEEYKLLVDNVMDMAFRRDTIQRLEQCENLCYSGSKENIQQQIYDTIDDVMTEYSTTNDVLPFKDIVDECWEEIKSRQGDGYAGIPFKFPTLNEYATIERGELFVFAAEAKQGKSMMLLNCAVDLLKRGYSVLYIDSELNSRLHTARLLSHLTGIEYKRVIAGGYSPEEEEKIQGALAWSKETNYTHMYLPMFDLKTIYTTVKKVQHTHGLDVLIVDYFKSSGEGDAFNSYQELGRFVDKHNICSR